MKKYISIIVIILFFKISNSQSLTNSLFLVVDKHKDTVIQINKKSNVNIEYYHFNEQKNWNLSLRHQNSPNNVHNNYIYLLPKEMITELERKGNVKDIRPFMLELNNFNYKELNQYFSMHYSYYYEYLEKSRKKTYKRYNIFIIFKSDLTKEYIPCRELSLITSRIKVI